MSKIKMRLIIAGLLSALALILGVSTPVAAQVSTTAPVAVAAADPYIWVCNDASSDDDITAYHLTLSYRINIVAGDCQSINDRNGGARVDVDPAGHRNDIDSYKWFKGYYPVGGGSWGPCYNNENGAANPFSGGLYSTKYRTSKYLDCV